MKKERRCAWSEGVNDLYIDYHDTEWGVPVHDDRKQFEFLILEGAQAGLSWSTVLNKRENFRKAFTGFDPVKVARFNQRKIESLLKDPGIIRNRLKVASAVTNAKRFLEVQKEFGSFDRIHLAIRGRKTHPEPPPHHEGYPCNLTGVRRAQQRSQTEGIHICRKHDHVCPHAGRRYGQRSCDELFSIRNLREIGLPGPKKEVISPRHAAAGSEFESGSG